MRKMVALPKMPYTYICMLIGSLALVAIPPFQDFLRLIIEAVMMSRLPGYHFAAFCVVGAMAWHCIPLECYLWFFMVSRA